MKLTAARIITTIALAVCLLPSGGFAESLQIFRGDPAQAITLAPGAKTIVTSAFPIHEIAVASPGMAGIAHVSLGNVAVTGNSAGRTTLTLLHDSEVDNVTQVDILVTPNADIVVLPDDTASYAVQPIVLPPTPKPQVIEVKNGVVPHDIPLAAHQSIVLKTDVPFTKIVSADDLIAVGSVLWDGKGAYLLGMSAGTTTLTLSREGTAEDTQLNIVVTW